ncbi:MAG: hypothetical protein LBI05_09615 [Planctomycetaceae bacterium]|jgi:hypothetical protein|nr:hypothetical protein [Planctomycetaceae bacterium]
MSLFLNHLWIWIVLAFIVGISTSTWYLNNQNGRNLVIAVLAPLLTLALGLSLYYGVDTDRKSIARMLNTLIAAVERDDLETVHGFITEKAVDVRLLAAQGMRLAKISSAKYHDLEIEVNDAASPPLAKVHFSAAFYVQPKKPIDGVWEKPIPERATLEIELVKTKDRSWRVSKCPLPQMRFL